MAEPHGRDGGSMRIEDAIVVLDCKEHLVATLNLTAAVRKGEGTREDAVRNLAEKIREIVKCP